MPLLTPEQSASLEKAFQERAQAAVAAVTTPTGPASADKPVTPPVTAEPTDKVAGATSGAVSSAEVAQPDKAQAPDWKDSLDLSALPEDVRSKIHFDDERAYAAFKASTMAHAEATRRFQEAAKLRKDAEAIERDANNYRALVSDPEKAKRVAKIVLGEDTAEPDQPAPELDLLDPAAVKAELDKREKALLDKIRAEREAELARPQQIKDAAERFIADFAAQNGTTVEIVTKAAQLAHADLVKDGGVWDLATAPTLLRPYLRLVQAEKPTAPTPPNGSANKVVPPVNGRVGLSEVASPVGRGGAHVDSFVQPPKFYVNGERPRRPLTDEEWSEEHEYKLRLLLGPNVNPQDVRMASQPR